MNLLAYLIAVAPDPVDPWGIAGRVLAIALGALAVAGVFVWRSVARGFFCWCLELCEDDVMTMLGKQYAQRIIECDGHGTRVGIVEDKLEFLEESLKAQGQALTDSLGNAVRAQTRAMEHMAETSDKAATRIADNSDRALERITHVIERIAGDTAANTVAIAALEGFLRSPESGALPNRRKKPTRRKP